MADFDALKEKYSSVLQLIKRRGVVLAHLHVQDEKLYMQGAAPNHDVKNEVWNEIKAVDADYGDITVDLSIDENLPQPAPDPVIYTVEAGDSLWKIAAKHYGNGALYPRIIEANPDKLENEHSVIHPGDTLTIPPAE